MPNSYLESFFVILPANEYSPHRLSQDCSRILQASLEVLSHNLKIYIIGSNLTCISSLDPEGDPLCVLLMIDYYALRADEPGYLLALFECWEVCTTHHGTTWGTHKAEINC